MFHKNIKLVLSGLILAAAIYQFAEGLIGNGVFLTLLALIPVFFYFRNEIILLAFLRMRKQDLEGTEKWLSRIRHPEAALMRKQQGYYNFLYGIIYSQKNLTQSEKYLRNALKLGLNMSMDEAMAKLQLAGIAMTRRRKREATRLLQEAKKIDKHNMLADQIKMYQQQLKKI